MGLYNRDWDFGEEPQEQEVKVDKEEYLKMKENLERYRDFKETLIELIEEKLYILYLYVFIGDYDFNTSLKRYNIFKSHLSMSIEAIVYGDSYGNCFLVLPDGSYLLIKDGVETVWGEAWKVTDGSIYKICEQNETIIWTK